MTAKIFELKPQPPRPAPPGERESFPEVWQRRTGRIRHAGIELRFVGAMKKSDERRVRSPGELLADIRATLAVLEGDA